MRWLMGLIALIIVLISFAAYPFIVPPQAPNTGNAIVINKALNRLYYYIDGNLVATYQVATGREPELTPEGSFPIVTKIDDDNGLGADGIFGTRWLGLAVPDHEDGTKYGIHGTNEPKSIGDHASAGCVRMGKADIEELYEKVPIGSQVRIVRGSAIHRFIIDQFSHASYLYRPPAKRMKVSAIKLSRRSSTAWWRQSSWQHIHSMHVV